MISPSISRIACATACVATCGDEERTEMPAASAIAMTSEGGSAVYAVSDEASSRERTMTRACRTTVDSGMAAPSDARSR
jgi:hypothetical protein